VRVFVSDGGGWRQLVERTLPVTQTVVSLPFMGVGSDGRVWLGVRIEREDGGGERVAGVVVIDAEQETVLWHRRGAEHGAGSLPVPDEVSGIAFDGQGNAWLASLSGAIRVEEHQAIVFGEDRGVRGEVVTDVVSGEGRMWIASAEGLGAYAERRFDYGQPEIVRTHRPVALATDGNGHLWAAGTLGLLQHDGTTWLHFDATSGLPSSELRDVEVDGQGRVWALAAGEIYVLAP
jgi:ligand-binding sensor domain-containing protein